MDRMNYNSLLSNGYASDIVDTKEIHIIIMGEFNNIILPKILPCISLVNKIIYKKCQYSINFIKVFTCIMLQHGFLEFKDIIEILSVHTLFDTINDQSEEYSKYIIMETLRIIESNISASTDRVETKGNIIISNYNITTISTNEFDELMILLIPFLYLYDNIVKWRFLDVFESYVYKSDKMLSLKWLSNPVLFETIKSLFDATSNNTMSKMNFKDIYNHCSINSMIRLMCLSVIVIYYNPNFYSPETLNELYIENRACGLLRKKNKSRIKYYSKVFGGGYRLNDPVIVHSCVELPTCLVEHILSFAGIDELVFDLMNGCFHI